MTNSEENNRLDRIEQLQESNASSIEALNQALTINAESTKNNFNAVAESLSQLTANVQSLTNDVDRVLARSAILDDVLLGLHGNQQ